MEPQTKEQAYRDVVESEEHDNECRCDYCEFLARGEEQ